MADELLRVRHLTKHFPVKRGVLFAKPSGIVHAVDDVSFEIPRAGTFGLVGESGCGKTTTSRMILLLEPPSSGEIRFKGDDVTRMRGAAVRRYRSSVQAVFQDPYSSLSPRMRVGRIVGEPLRAIRGLPRKDVRKEVARLLSVVGLRSDAAESYPHEFSGGQRQRIAIARALATEPELIVLDEPVSALDLSIRAQIINLLREIQDRTGVGYLLIAHDLAVVKHMSHRIGVMYLGKLVELAESDDLYRRPLHPYTRALLSAALPAHPDRQTSEVPLSGEVPSPLDPPSGCRFRTRCPDAMPRCAEEEPALAPIGGGRAVACHLSSPRGSPSLSRSPS